MTYTQEITQIMASASLLASTEKNVEDAKHIYIQAIRKAATEQTQKLAMEHAEIAEFDGKKFDSFDDVIATFWGHFFGFLLVELKDLYADTFSACTPTINECHKCEKSYTGKSCPTCENRRFEADHSNL